MYIHTQPTILIHIDSNTNGGGQFNFFLGNRSNFRRKKTQCLAGALPGFQLRRIPFPYKHSAPVRWTSSFHYCLCFRCSLHVHCCRCPANCFRNEVELFKSIKAAHSQCVQHGFAGADCAATFDEVQEDDPVFALGFVTVYDQLMEGYPSDEDRDAIFQAYINALKEDPQQYRVDAQKLEEWARGQTSSLLVEFSTRDGEVEAILEDIAERAGSKESFSYSRFIAVGLFRLLELANATEPTVLEKLCEALNIDKRSVNRDLDVYRNMLSKLVQAKELLKEYVEREKKKREERSESPATNEAVKKFSGLQRCGKNYRMRWTNYLRPGIKRGRFFV